MIDLFEFTKKYRDFTEFILPALLISGLKIQANGRGKK